MHIKQLNPNVSVKKANYETFRYTDTFRSRNSVAVLGDMQCLQVTGNVLT